MTERDLTGFDRDGFAIGPVRNEAEYEGLRDLWCRVFGDSPGYVDDHYRIFGDEIQGYAVTDAAGKVVSGLTCYKCGNYVCEEADGDDADAVCESSRATENEGDAAPGRDASPERDAAIERDAAPGRNASPELVAQADPNGAPVYVSYAICTDPEYRGRGLAGTLTEYVRDMHGISVVSPAEESLEEFYEHLGYTRVFYVEEKTVCAYGADDFDYDHDISSLEDDEVEAFEPDLSIVSTDAYTYNKYREAFLAGAPHVALSERMLELVRHESAGGDGMLIINGGDAICVVAELPDTYRTDRCISSEGVKTSDGPATAHPADAEDAFCLGTDCRCDEGGSRLKISELLVNPMLQEISEEIDEEIAARLAKHYGAARAVYRTPGGKGKCQSMAAGLARGGNSHPAAYYGFPID